MGASPANRYGVSRAAVSTATSVALDLKRIRENIVSGRSSLTNGAKAYHGSEKLEN